MWNIEAPVRGPTSGNDERRKADNIPNGKPGEEQHLDSELSEVSVRAFPLLEATDVYGLPLLIQREEDYELSLTARLLHIHCQGPLILPIH